MSGKLILDALAVFKASRKVVSSAAALQRDQFNAYSKTSSLANTLRLKEFSAGETVRHPASDLSQAANDANQPRSTETGAGFAGDSSVIAPKQRSVQSQTASGQNLITKNQPFKPRQPDSNATTHSSLLLDSVGKSQEKVSGGIRHTPDRIKPQIKELQQTSRGGYSTPIHPQEARVVQRQAEKQIPSEAAEPPTPSPGKEDSGLEGLYVDQEQDVSFSPPRKTGAVLSALPRIKLPKHTETAQELDEHLPDQHLNADTFYSSTPQNHDSFGQSTHPLNEHNDLPDEVESRPFRSTRAASSLPTDQNKSAELEDVKTRTQNAGRKTFAEGFSSQKSSTSDSAIEQDHSFHQLASDLASDVDRHSAGPFQLLQVRPSHDSCFAMSLI